MPRLRDISELMPAEAVASAERLFFEFPPDDEDYRPQKIAHVESMDLNTIIPLISERVTRIVIDWSDGSCRAELKSGSQSWIGRGPRASVALGRAMMLRDDQEHSRRTESHQ